MDDDVFSCREIVLRVYQASGANRDQLFSVRPDNQPSRGSIARRLTSTVDPCVMTVSEFSKIASVYQRRTAFSLFIPLGITMPLLGIYAFFRDHIESFLALRFGDASGSVVVVVPMMVLVLIMIFGVYVMSRRIEREAGVLCPSCSKQLASMQHIVIASKSCPFCGVIIVTQEPQGSTKTVEPTG